MKTYALVDASGTIINRVVLSRVFETVLLTGGVGGSGGDGGNSPEWSPPEGCTVVEETTTPLEIGGTIKSGKYTPPKAPDPVTPPKAQPLTPAEKLAATGLTVADLKALLK
jgi:hypothetical protein